MLPSQVWITEGLQECGEEGIGSGHLKRTDIFIQQMPVKVRLDGLGDTICGCGNPVRVLCRIG